MGDRRLDRVNKLLPKHFYAHDALEVAPKVLGATLRRGEVVLRITEVEAYRWPGDTANHGRHGRTRCNDAIWDTLKDRSDQGSGA